MSIMLFAVSRAVQESGVSSESSKKAILSTSKAPTSNSNSSSSKVSKSSLEEDGVASPRVGLLRVI